MTNLREEGIRVIKQLLEEDKAQEAILAIGRFESINEEDDLILTVFKIHAFSSLERIKDALTLLTDKIYYKTRIFGKHEELTKAIVKLAATLRKNDRLGEAFSLIERSEKMLSEIQIREKERLSLLASLLDEKGSLYWHKSELDKAFSTWEKTLEINKTLGNKKQIGLSFSNIGLIYWSKGDLDTAGEYFNKYLTISQELGDKENIGKALNNIGIVYHGKGELDKALDYYKKSLVIREEVGDELTIGKILNNIGEVYRRKGELSIALDYYQRSLQIKQRIGDQKSIAVAYDNIGSIYFTRGDLTQALKYYRKAFSIQEAIEDPFHVSYSLKKIGLVYRSKGNYKEAYDCFTKALSFLKQISNDIRIAEILYYLVILNTENESIDEAKRFLQELEQISNREDNKIVSQQCRLAKATVLKNSKRLLQRTQAQQVFSDIAREEIVNHSLTVYAMLNLSGLLLDELQMIGGDVEVLREVKELAKNLLNVAKSQNSFSLLTQIYLLQSKLALLELDIPRAEQLLMQSLLTAEEKGLWRLQLVISSESDALRLQLSNWEELIERNASFFERLELAQVNRIVKLMIQKRVEDVNILPQFAIKKIRVSLFKMGMTGPIVAVSQPLLFTKNEESVLSQMALFYTASLGQGQNAAVNIGLFGPLPVPTVPNHVGIVYSFFIKDPEYADPRCKGLTYTILVFSMPRSLGYFFRERDRISRIIEKALKPIKEINEIELEFLLSVKYKVMGLERKIEDQNIE